MPNLLTINAGSSSIRFAIFAPERPPKPLLQGKIDRIGTADARFSIDYGIERATSGGNASTGGKAATGDKASTGGSTPTGSKAKIDGSAVRYLLEWLQKQPLFSSIGGVGHRVVHGMQHSDPERVTAPLVAELKSIIAFDPEHLPREIELIEALQQRFPDLPQAVCFDTAFHRSMPLVATQLPIPRRYAAQGVQRYGFHGLSYTFLLQELRRLGDPAATSGRLILAHLGSGASLAAVRNGRCVDTSMGFTPTAGLVMGTRSGDLDPGLMSYLASSEAMSADRFRTLVNHESGLLGVSETSADVRDLLERETSDGRAAEALALFCYQAKKWIGAFAAVLGGVDTLVFAGGIGENAAPVRQRICEGLGYLGIDIDEHANARHAPRISSASGAVAVRVIRTDEESVIAEASIRLLQLAAT